MVLAINDITKVTVAILHPWTELTLMKTTTTNNISNFFSNFDLVLWINCDEGEWVLGLRMKNRGSWEHHGGNLRPIRPGAQQA